MRKFRLEQNGVFQWQLFDNVFKLFMELALGFWEGRNRKNEQD